jgi:hypothetical protein
MKAKNFPLYALAFLSALNPLLAQNKLIGLSGFGKNNQSFSGGMAWEVNTDGTGFNALKTWDFPRIGVPAQQLIEADNGQLFGITQGFEGADAALYLVAFDPASGTQQTLQTIRRTDFEVANTFSNFNLTAPLFKGNDGYFYASHNLDYKGANIFRVSGDGQAMETIHRIDGEIEPLAGLGQLPNGQLVAASRSKVYAGSPNGNNWNLIYAFPPNVSFITGIVAGSDGWIYGIVQDSPENSWVFKIQADGSEYEEIAWLNMGMISDFILGQNGKLLALMVQDEMVQLIQVATNGATTSLSSFNSQALPVNNSLLQTPDGRFYVNTVEHTVLQISVGNPVQILANLPATYGSAAGRLALQGGRLYGWEQGKESRPNHYRGVSGAFFQLETDGSGFQYLEEIDRAPATGAFPDLLLKADDGAYYGAVSAGGAHQSGLIFRMASDGSGYTPLYETPELAKVTRLVEGGGGRLVGSMTMIEPSGIIIGSQIFSIALDGSDFTVLANFTSYTEPAASFTIGGDGKIYWMRSNHLMRMDLNGANKTDLGERPQPGSGTYNYVGQLVKGQGGVLYGHLDFSYELPGFEDGSGRLLFTLDAGNTLVAQKNVLEDFLDFVQGPDGAYYSRYYHYSGTTLSLSVNQDIGCLYTPQLAGSNDWLYGTTVNPFTNDLSDLRAYQTDNGDCRQVIPAALLGYQSKFCFETAGTTAVAPIQNSSALLLSPIPAHQTLYLELEPAKGEITWAIYSMTGELVGDGISAERAWFIDVTPFPPGAYIVRVSDTNGGVWLQKMIKQ